MSKGDLDKETLEKVLIEEKDRYERLRIDETYFSRLVIAEPNQRAQLKLGEIQTRVRSIKKYIEFLEEKLKK